MLPVLIETLSKNYAGRSAIDSVSFQVKPKTVHGLLGLNGAGKSTTMRIMAGILSPNFGDVKIGDYSVTRHQLKVKALIGFLPENPPLYFNMTVYDYLDFAASLHKTKNKEKSISESIDRCGLQNVRNRLIGNLSKGMKQRVGIAQAIVSNPPVLIFDEPTIGLDPSSIQEIRKLILELKEEHTILLSSHILHEIELLCSEITIIHKGRVIRSGPIGEDKNDLEGVFLKLTEAGK